MKKILSLLVVLSVSLVVTGSASFAAKNNKKTSSKKNAKIEQKISIKNPVQNDKVVKMVLNAISNGDLETAKYLIEESNIDINSADENGTTLLMKACCNTNLDLVKYLVENKADITKFDKNNYNALMYAVEKSTLDIVSYLFEESDTLSIEQIAKDHMGLLSLAIKNNDFRILRYLVESQNFDITLSNEKGQTLALLAAGYGKLDSVKYLIDKAANITAKDNNGNNILMYAAASGNLALVKYIVNASIVDINEKNNDDKTAKDIAVAHNQTEIAKFLDQKV
ncbi:MAG: ankyrin repeat domain-containing protein [Elusimicrobia bacterium]|nr:ankyrin repeat domain-containing protein [Elusimicrobiota bacterium]